jgi:hypothetical protein
MQTLKEIAPQGHVRVIGSRTGFRVKVIAENIKLLQDSKQSFDSPEIADQNILALLQLFDGEKVLVLNRALFSAYWLKANGDRQFIDPVISIKNFDWKKIK